MKRTLTTMTVAAIASAALVLPAPTQAADEPPPDPCAAQVAQLTDQVAYWRARADEANANASAQAAVAVERALAAEDRAERAALQLGARTAQRNRLLVRAQRLEAQRDRLRIRVERLRERLAATR